MNTFRKKWNHKAVQDDGSVMSKEAKSFVTAFRNMLKRELTPFEIEVVTLKPGHYDLYGFLKRGDTYVYVSFNIPRYGEPIDFDKGGCLNNTVLYRYAKDDKDYRGERNTFTTISQLPCSLRAAFDAREDQSRRAVMV